MNKPCFVALWLVLTQLLYVSCLASETGLESFAGLQSSRDWPWWRGPQRNGIAPVGQPPVHFGADQNIVWKSPIPGRGHSSPIIVDGRVYLASADESTQTQFVLGYDLATGRQLWNTEVSQGGFPAKNHPKNTEATPTLASDGQLLFASFFHHQRVQLVALTADGAIAWRSDVAPYNPLKYQYGYAASPVLYRDSLIIATEYDGASFLTAFDRRDGSRLWRVTRPSNITFSTPVVAELAGRDQLLISGSDLVCAYDPQNGKLLWSVPGTTAATCGTMVWTDELVIASGGFPKAETLAIAADGSRSIAWKNNQRCYEQSMIVVDDHVYALTDKGVLFCWNAADGKERWRKRLSGPVSALPVYAGGYIYWANESGTIYVFRPNPERFDLVAENRLGDEAFASPAVSQNRILFRIAEGRRPDRQEYLVCIGSQP